MELGNLVLELSRQYNQTPASHFSDVVTGTVTGLNPLKIKVGDKLELNEKVLILSAFVKETWIDIPTTTGQEAGEDNGTDGSFMHRHHIVGETELANDGGQGASPHKHSINIYTKYELPRIRLWRGLKVGDMVYMLRVGRGQTFFVLQRIQGITNET